MCILNQACYGQKFGVRGVGFGLGAGALNMVSIIRKAYSHNTKYKTALKKFS